MTTTSASAAWRSAGRARKRQACRALWAVARPFEEAFARPASTARRSSPHCRDLDLGELPSCSLEENPDQFDNSLSAALARRGIHYGWVVAAVTFLCCCAPGPMGLPGALIPCRSTPIRLGTAASLLGARRAHHALRLMAPFAAALMNRYGLRNVQLFLPPDLVALVAATSCANSGTDFCSGGWSSGWRPGLTRWCSRRPSPIAGREAARPPDSGLLSARAPPGSSPSCRSAPGSPRLRRRSALLPAGIGVLVAASGSALPRRPAGRYRLAALGGQARPPARGARGTPSRPPSPCSRSGAHPALPCSPPSSSAAVDQRLVRRIFISFSAISAFFGRFRLVSHDGRVRLRRHRGSGYFGPL